MTLRLLSDGSCRRVFRIHLGCDRTSGSKLLQRALKACCEKITLWVFAGHWLRAPRTRGWTGLKSIVAAPINESPAHAGMDRTPQTGSWNCAREPRARGDGPVENLKPAPRNTRAPRTRGWTPGRRAGPVPGRESPAHAGMDLRLRWLAAEAQREPRARGDGPKKHKAERRRRWRAPRTRGWTDLRGGGFEGRHESPAHAGMDRGVHFHDLPGSGEPRARGDGPPGPVQQLIHGPRAPRTRGWTADQSLGRAATGESPAHAGMDRGQEST